MSTNPQHLNPRASSETTIARSKRSVDRSIRTLMHDMEHENTLVQESLSGRLQRALKIFRGVKPMLAILSSLPLIPSTWRAAIVMLMQALEALQLAGPGLTPQFKAGKDI
ncbi:MAG TPA: hypothetical protein VFV49_10095 [Thermoanaerobaculia bacterium]|nr:hypothetical protein [Thermoanaerobaculia bacterium]